MGFAVGICRHFFYAATEQNLQRACLGIFEWFIGLRPPASVLHYDYITEAILLLSFLMSPLSLSGEHRCKRICRLQAELSVVPPIEPFRGFYILCKKFNRNWSAVCGCEYKKQFPMWGIELVVKRVSVRFVVVNGAVLNPNGEQQKKTEKKSKAIARTSPRRFVT